MKWLSQVFEFFAPAISPSATVHGSAVSADANSADLAAADRDREDSRKEWSEMELAILCAYCHC